MRFALSFTSVFSLLALFTSAAHAVPYAYSEVPDGDLPFVPVSVLPFDSGVNTVAGYAGFDGVVTDTDSFSFNVPVGRQITAISLEMNDEAGDPVSSTWNLSNGLFGDPFPLLVGLISSTSPGTGTFVGILPQPAGNYTMIHDVPVTYAGPGANVAVYGFSITLSPVPEPASLSLIALGATTLVRRKR